MNAVDAISLWPKMHVTRISDVISDTRVLAFQGTATPDGRFLLAKLLNRYDPSAGPNSPEQVVLYDPISGAIKVIGSASDNKHGVTGIVADNHWVIWYERGLPELSNDSSWTLYAYNIDTGIVKTIEHNNESGPGNGVYPSPQIDQGELIWDDTTGEVTLDKSTYRIRLMDLSTLATRSLAQKAASPVISWPWVGWDQVINADPANFQGDEQFTNLQTGESVTLPVMAGEKVLMGTSLIYTDSNSNSTSFTYIPDIHHPDIGKQTIDPIDNLTVNAFSFNGRYIGWHSLGDRDTPTLYDVQSRQLIRLPLQYRPIGTEYTFIAAKYLVWEEDPNSDAQDTAYQNQHKEPPLIESIVDLSSVIPK